MGRDYIFLQYISLPNLIECVLLFVHYIHLMINKKVKVFVSFKQRKFSAKIAASAEKIV